MISKLSISFLALIASLLGGSFLSANSTDSLDTYINTIRNKEFQVDSLLKASKSLLHYNPVLSIYAAKSALEKSEKIDLTKGVLKSTLLLTENYYLQDSLTAAAPLLNGLNGIENQYWDLEDRFAFYNFNGLMSEFNGNNKAGVQFYLKAYDVAVEKRDTLLMAMSLHNLAGRYADMEDLILAKTTQQSALDYFKKVEHFNYTTNAYINLAQRYLCLGQYDSSLYNQKIAQDRVFESKDYYGIIHNYEGFAHMYDLIGNRDSAFHYFKLALSTLYEHQNQIANGQRLKVYLQTGLAESYYAARKYDSAYKYINRAYYNALQLESEDGLKTLYYPLSRIYEAQGKLDSSLSFFESYHNNYVEKYKEENKRNLDYILLQHELELKDRDHAEEIRLKEKRQTIVIILSLSFILILAFGILAYRQKLKNQKQRSENEELLRQTAELKSNQLEQDLELKNKELSTKMMYLAKKNEFIASTSKELKAFNKELSQSNKKKLYSILRNFETSDEKDNWKEFEMTFQEIHQDYYHKLSKQYPDLTANDLRLCAFLKLNLSTKEICSITYQSPESVKTARYRLRKKLNLGREVNLTTFLNTI